MDISVAIAPKISWDRNEDLILSITQLLRFLKTWYSISTVHYYPNYSIVKNIIKNVGLTPINIKPPITESKLIYFVYPPNKPLLSPKLNELLVDAFKKTLSKFVTINLAWLVENKIHIEKVIEIIEVSSDVYVIITRVDNQDNIYVTRTKRRYCLTIVKDDHIFINELQE